MNKKAGLPCHEQSLEEGQLEGQICEFLKSVYLDGKEVEKAIAAVEEERNKVQGLAHGIKESIEGALEKCFRNMDNVTKLRYREMISDEEFVRQRGELKREEITLKERLGQLETDGGSEPSRNLVLFSNRSVFWLTHGTVAEKRLILSTVGSNLTIKAKKLSICANEPFQVLLKRRSIPT